MSALDGAVTHAGWAATWAGALEALELDVAETEALLDRLHLEADWVPPTAQGTTWAPPTTAGPLPATLADRARALLARHQHAAEQLTRAMLANRRQARASGRLADAGVGHQQARPVYVDTAV